MSIKLIFDFGGVLLHWDPHFIYERHFNCREKAQNFFDETQILQLNREFDRGQPQHLGLENLAGKFPHYREAIFLWQEQWTASIRGEITGSVNLLNRLYKQGYDLYGLTNWSAETFPYALQTFPFLQYFKDIVVSGEVKLIKPDPKIYQLLLNRNQLAARGCIFIDDLAENVAAAEKLGITSIQFKSAELLEKALEEHGVLA